MNDSAFEGLTAEGLKVEQRGQAMVSFLADETTLSSTEHPILAVWVLPRLDGDHRDYRPFRVVPAELWSVENNINLGNMDWMAFASSVGGDGAFRGF